MGEEETKTFEELEVIFDALNEKKISLAEAKKRIKAIDDQKYSTTFDRISDYLEKNLPNVRQRLDNFRTKLDQESPSISEIIIQALKDPKSVDAGGLFLQITIRSIALRIMEYMHVPLTLYALNMNGPAIIDLHGLLERFVIGILSEIFSSSKEQREILQRRIFEQRTLNDLAPILNDLGYWDTEDMKFARKLSRLRNAIAHKNTRKLSNLIYSGKKISDFAIETVMKDVDFIPLIIQTIHLLIKTMLFHIRQKEMLEFNES